MRRLLACAALVAGAFFLPAASAADTPFPGEPNPLTVRLKTEPSPQILMGFIVNGAEAPIAAIEAAAKKAGVLSTRVDEPDNGGPLELMVFFRPPFDHARGLDLFRSAKQQKFGASKVEAMVVTAEQYRSDGGVTADEISKIDASAVAD